MGDLLIMTNITIPEVSESQQYITRRVLDACLRENVLEITSSAEIVNSESIEGLLTHWVYALPEQWLSISTLGDFTLLLPIQASQFIQPWKVATPAWLFINNDDKKVVIKNHYQHWLNALSNRLSNDKKSYYQTYIDECDCAIAHRNFAQEIIEQQYQTLNQKIFTLPDAWQKFSAVEQLAAHLDHPLYPTARAKFGLNESDIQDYCPEAMNSFQLNWLAVPKNLYCTTVTVQPTQWPSFSDVGLAESLRLSHQLIPVHPLTFSQYLSEKLNDWPHKNDIHYAPLSYLTVKATLSVRSMLLVDEPHIHIKLPLPMHTLGSKNIRTIKPSTINDGYVFQQVLQYIGEKDPLLSPLYLHSHEQQGGHVDQRADLAWLIREYPEQINSTSPVCVAAFMAENPEGTLVIEQLAQQYYQSDISALLADYFSLLLKVHLRLWLVYGITLEANQQNCLVLFHPTKPLKLLFRDNDSGRILARRLLNKRPELQGKLNQFIDQRMFVDDEKSLLQMFTTINLQLNMTCLINDLAMRELVNEVDLYRLLKQSFTDELAQLTKDNVDTSYIEKHLLAAPLHYAKYLLTAGSLLSKQESGASSINKFYGRSALNPFMSNHLND